MELKDLYPTNIVKNVAKSFVKNTVEVATESIIEIGEEANICNGNNTIDQALDLSETVTKNRKRRGKRKDFTAALLP